MENSALEGNEVKYDKGARHQMASAPRGYEMVSVLRGGTRGLSERCRMTELAILSYRTLRLSLRPATEVYTLDSLMPRLSSSITG